ncbi:Regulatory protein BlaR1 [Massilia sp. Bi118]|uniref:M56 family metallopeptidase n=1 Tax=Massilia sp. Bi118 TaxID=2822346 RepID=UPI001D29AA49|nr:M56 family metallopeptidase [Massilia sp. Bi118]CAH0173329.1 Regulatory protein BlaR1 [Massilia sp. Bi118]
MSAPALIAAVGWTLVHFVWQGALLGCIVAVLLTALRNARPETRYAVACAGLLLCLAWPTVDLALLLKSGTGAESGKLFRSGAAAMAAAPDAAGLLPWLGRNLGWIVALWAGCAGALSLRMAVGLLWIGRAARIQASDAAWQERLSRLAERCGLGREVRLRVVDGLTSPITAGWWRPVVLVPASLVAGMPPHLLEALLVHELGHVRRHDYLVNLLQNVIETLLFYHPAVWWLSRRIRAEREQIADDFAARHLGEPRRLALALSELEKLQFSSHHLAQAANGGDLMGRIRRLLRPDVQALNWKAAIPVLGLAVVCAASAHAPVSRATASAHPVGVRQAAVVDFNTCRKPHYPKDDITAGHQGTVTLGFMLDERGTVLDVSVRKSSGYASLDEAARGALALCNFRPALEDGVPVKSMQPVQYVWTLK